MGLEFKDKIMLPCFREVKCLKCQQGYIAVLRYIAGLRYIYTILGYFSLTCDCDQMVSNYEFNFNGPESFPERVSKSLFFNSDIRTFC